MWFLKELDETPDMLEFMNQLRKVTYTGFASAHDDAIDCVSQLGLIDTRTPVGGGDEEFQVVSRNNGGIWDDFDNGDDGESGSTVF